MRGARLQESRTDAGWRQSPYLDAQRAQVNDLNIIQVLSCPIHGRLSPEKSVHLCLFFGIAVYVHSTSAVLDKTVSYLINLN